MLVTRLFETFSDQTRNVVLLIVRLCFGTAPSTLGGEIDAFVIELLSLGGDEAGVMAATEKVDHHEASFACDIFASLQASIRPWSILLLCFGSSSSSIATMPTLFPCPDP
jgi:hypothetical protein